MSERHDLSSLVAPKRHNNRKGIRMIAPKSTLIWIKACRTINEEHFAAVISTAGIYCVTERQGRGL